jgi:hypothetical protein
MPGIQTLSLPWWYDSICLTPPHQDCKITKQIDKPATTRHIEECTSICTGCVLRRIYIKDLPQFGLGRPCSHREEKTDTDVGRDLCSTCASASDGEIMARREEREKTELENEESGRVVCSFCHKHVRMGPRWWVCSACGRPCDSNLHASWVMRENK